MKYFVRIGKDQHEVEVDGDEIRVDGTAIRAQLVDLEHSPVQLLMIGDVVTRVLGRRVERGTYDLSLGGHRLTVEALDERSRAIRALSGASGHATGPAHLVAPMPGLVVRVNVSEGDQVKPGQPLVVMEAMKMENELRATSPGVVKRVAISAGSAVEKGALLLEMAAGS
jgi:pyruvate carboxylase subunit B